MANDFYVVVRDDRSALNAKGAFDNVSQAIIDFSPDKLVGSISSFAVSLNESLSNLCIKAGGFELKEIEFSIELNASGQIGLIASAQAGTAGGIKLLFKKS